MKNYLINCNSEISIQNFETKKFISIDSNKKIINVKGIHPIFKPKFKNEENLLIKNINNKQSNDSLTYGNSVLICNIKQFYLSALSNGEVKIDYLEDNFNKERLFKFNIYLSKDILSKKNVMQFETVILKCPYGNYLSSDENGNLISFKKEIDDYCKWQIFDSNTPPFPDWTIFRSNISNLNLLNSEKEQYFGDKKILNSYKYNKNSLNLEIPNDLKTQELIILNELLFALIGNEGDYIKKIINPKNEQIYVLLNNESINPSLYELVNKILPLATYYENILLFESIKSNFNQGFINQALSSGINQIKKEYLVIINMLDSELKKNNLNLQKLNWLIQPIWKIFENLNGFIKEIYDLKGGMILNILFDFIQNSVDDQLKNVFQFLFSKCLSIYLEILGKWIFYGILDDDYGEFFVKERNLDISNLEEIKYSENYWETKYYVDSINVPIFYQNIANKIFLTGKYLNVIKFWDPQRKIPSFEELNISNNQGNYDITENLEKVYNWSNLEIIKIILIENDFLLRLNTLKNFLFFDTGDFLSFFIDFSEEELNKDSSIVSIEKLNNFWDLSIRYSILNNNKLKNEVFCEIKPFTLLEMLKSYKTYNKTNYLNFNENKKEENSYKAFKYLGFNFKMNWPNNLIFSENKICVYQIISKFLWFLKYNEYQLNKFWNLIHSLKFQNNNSLKLEGNFEIMKYIQLIINKMLYIVKGLFQYILVDVIENKFSTLNKKIKNVLNNWKNSNIMLYNFEDIIKWHEEYLKEIIDESLIFDYDFCKWMVNFFSLIHIFCNKLYNYINQKLDIDLDGFNNINDNDENIFYDKKKLINDTKIEILLSFEKDKKFKSTIKKYYLRYNEFIKDIVKLINTKQNSLDINYNNWINRLFCELS